jgi:hypothetical protein
MYLKREEFVVPEEHVKGKWYEFLCNSLGLFDFPLSKDSTKSLADKLEFCGLRIKASRVYSAVVILILLGIAISIPILLLSYVYGIMIAFAFIGFAFYMMFFPSMLVKYHRIKATSDLIQTAFYLIVSLRLVPNLESALVFASKNVGGIVGRDLKKMTWDMSIGNYTGADEVLERFATKWKQENIEFFEAVDLIRTSIMQPKERRETMLDEAINVMLQRNMERMKHYSTQLRNPLLIITTIGITLPVLTIILFPIMTIFLAETIKPYMLFFFYDIVLPLLIYYIMNETLSTRPVTFGVIDISQHPKARSTKWYDVSILGKRIRFPTFFLAYMTGLLIVFAGIYLILIPSEPVGFTKILGGIVVLGGIASAILVYSFFIFFGNMAIRNEIRDTEYEFDEALYQLGYTLATGVPLETALERSYKRTKHLKVSGLFEKMLWNIKRFGFTMKRALFDEKFGALRYYPSKTIRSVMGVISDSIEKGVAGTSKTMLSISQYLKSMHLVEEHMRETLDETTSSMKVMMLLLVPIASGAVVGMSTIMTMVLFEISRILTSVTGLAAAYPQNFAPDVLGTIVDVKNIMPGEAFLIVVGIYMIEIIVMLASFVGTLEHGDDPLDKYQLIATNILISMTIFTFSVLFMYFIFKGLISFIWVT